jgi:peptide/nickel transport system ATP-binding protein
MSPILAVKNLSISFDGQTTLVDQVSFSLSPGEIKGIVGESGSGKSITVFSLIRLLDKAIVTGEALYTDKAGQTHNLLTVDLQTLQKIRGGEIGFVFQEPMTSLNPSTTCGLQIDEAIVKHLNYSASQAKQRSLELLSEVKLTEVERIYSSYPHQLSGGQRQRVMIAMALAANPQILIADEPTTALDVTVQKSVVELIKQLAIDRHMAVLFISHDLGLVQYIADKTIVMFKGQILEEASSTMLVNHPTHAYTQALVNSRPSLNATMDRLPVFDERYELIKSEIKPKNHTDSKVLIKVNQIKKHFTVKKDFWGRPKVVTKAVDDVSFEINQGKTLAIVGESGSGKSTVSKLLLNLEAINAGDIYFEDQKISGLTESQFKPFRRQMQMVFQDPYSSLNPYHTIEEIIAEPLHIFNIDIKSNRKERVASLLKKVHLPQDFMSRHPHQLSGGQRQRICIARALATSPPFIICDESVAALDVSVQATVLNLLKDLQEELNLTYLFITHDLHVARFISHTTLVMQKGRVEEYGKTSELFDSPQSSYLQNLLLNIF